MMHFIVKKLKRLAIAIHKKYLSFKNNEDIIDYMCHGELGEDLKDYYRHQARTYS